jgi:hypothetical protein
MRMCHQEKIEDETARQVYTNAIDTRIRNEHALMTVWEAIHGTGLTAIDGSKTREEYLSDAKLYLKKNDIQLNLDALFGGMDYCECKEYQSAYTSMAMPLLLIAGIPATGKTYFSEWLESKKRFLYICVDNDPSMRSAGLEEEWKNCLICKDASKFVSTLRLRNQPIVLEWGFPPRYLSIIEVLKHKGFSIWWFDADHEAARNVFIKRGTVSLQAFEIQMQRIESNWESIETMFAPNIITTLDASGKHMTVKQIYRRIKDRTG